MHFNPRFKPKQVVVFNTFRHRRWECEERVQKMPFTPGESFEVLFAVTCEGYQVVVNGAPFYLFKHRIPVQRVTGLQIGGDVSMETVIIGSMPIVVPIHCGLKHGMSLSFKGSIPQDIKRFHINLQSGVESGCNKTLHFNPQFDGTEVVVFNSFQRGSWENEERPSEMPFRKGEDFEIVMNVTAQGYEVKVNGRPFHVFKHRMPVATATAIKIAGDVIMRSFNIEMVNPNMEYIYGGLRCGMSLYFKGTVPQDAKRFSINLHCGSAQGCDNAFHFNPQLDSKVVVFNTMRKGGWEKEERPKEMPFRRGEDFELVYKITAEGYQVNVNGNPFYFFKHRMPFEDVTAIRFVLDVNMEIINVIENEDSYTGTIYGGLREGMYLYFRGTVNQRVDGFSINLQYSQQRGYVKAMHFNPRFKHDPMVVFNTLTRRKWQREEIVHRMPF
ncbi:hypothetical protein ANANG_G00239160 [Anguilla anguilla]|uniref:Galectin n=1 Tax=Anguilla anguilla TaxID=7936 RepID=A0A9D3LX76_ANGAN|nr:hypothetical protein ANANG_G00239160 [Anguilla anguilla]